MKCEHCGVDFIPSGRNQSRRRYCSPKCGSAASVRRHFGPPRGLSCGTMGAISEMAAAVDLMKRGYEVFRALSPASSCDLIALGSFGALRIEVRTGQRSLVTGKLTFPRNGSGNKRSETDLDHYAVVVHHGVEVEVLYVPELRDKEGDGEMVACGLGDSDELELG